VDAAAATAAATAAAAGAQLQGKGGVAGRKNPVSG